MARTALRALQLFVLVRVALPSHAEAQAHAPSGETHAGLPPILGPAVPVAPEVVNRDAERNETIRATLGANYLSSTPTTTRPTFPFAPPRRDSRTVAVS